MQPLIIAVSTLMLIGLCQSAPSDDPNSCQCVPKFQCSENGTVVKDGADLIDIRIQDKPKPGEPCLSYLQVCCLPNYINTRSSQVAPPKPWSRGCGFANHNGVGFHVPNAKNGEAQFGEFPWMVALVAKDNVQSNNYIYKCGGSLIHPGVILTAAHCVNKIHPSLMMVRAGEWDTQTDLELYAKQDRYVAEVIVHENFKDASLFNDFALLRLDKPFEYDAHLDLACLPDDNIVPDSKTCYASGWGKQYFGKEGEYQVILKKVQLPTVPSQKCQDNLRKTRLGQYFELDKSFICAGGEHGKDACTGDGGSPLVCQYPHYPGRYYQAGIVSWGIGCGQLDVPGVYSNVVYAKPWILHHLDQWYKASLIHTY